MLNLLLSCWLVCQVLASLLMQPNVAHYYGHQSVGAWISYGFSMNEPTLPWLVSTHMAPFVNQKYFNSLSPVYKSWIEALHKADKEAH